MLIFNRYPLQSFPSDAHIDAVIRAELRAMAHDRSTDTEPGVPLWRRRAVDAVRAAGEREAMPAAPQWPSDFTGGTADDDATGPATLALDPVAHWRALAGDLDPFSFAVPTNEREHAACMLALVRFAANGRMWGGKPRKGKRHKNQAPTMPPIANKPAPSAVVGNAARNAANRQHDVEAAHDALGRAYLALADAEPGTPIVRLASAWARHYGARYAHHRIDRAFRPLSEAIEPACPETCANIARASLSEIRSRLTDDEKAKWDRARDSWRAVRDGVLPATDDVEADKEEGRQRSSHALRTLRTLTERSMARSR